MGRTFPVAAVAHFRVILILFPLMHSYCYSSLNDAYSVFFLNTLPLQRSSLIQINHCCIREMCKAVTDTAGQTNGSKPESLRSIGPSIFSIFFFSPLLFSPCSKKITQSVLSIVKNTGRGGGIYHSSLSAGKGPFEKDSG